MNGAPRIGHGVDVHAFSSDRSRPLVLAGVTVPDAPGLAGHSDADVVAHALADALLGAAAMGDLGSVFGTDDPELAGADSLGLLRLVVGRVTGAGWTVGNVDLTVVAEQPRLAGHVAAMRARLSDCLGLTPAAVSVKVTSSDGLGAVGGGQGIACLAACLLLPERPAPAADNRLTDRRAGGDR